VQHHQGVLNGGHQEAQVRGESEDGLNKVLEWGIKNTDASHRPCPGVMLGGEARVPNGAKQRQKVLSKLGGEGEKKVDEKRSASRQPGQSRDLAKKKDTYEEKGQRVSGI